MLRPCTLLPRTIRPHTILPMFFTSSCDSFLKARWCSDHPFPDLYIPAPFIPKRKGWISKRSFLDFIFGRNHQIYYGEPKNLRTHLIIPNLGYGQLNTTEPHHPKDELDVSPNLT
jgi:hypothetical protein